MDVVVCDFVVAGFGFTLLCGSFLLRDGQWRGLVFQVCGQIPELSHGGFVFRYYSFGFVPEVIPQQFFFYFHFLVFSSGRFYRTAPALACFVLPLYTSGYSLSTLFCIAFSGQFVKRGAGAGRLFFLDFFFVRADKIVHATGF